LPEFREDNFWKFRHLSGFIAIIESFCKISKSFYNQPQPVTFL
jgi:hypothetical protein